MAAVAVPLGMVLEAGAVAAAASALPVLAGVAVVGVAAWKVVAWWKSWGKL